MRYSAGARVFVDAASIEPSATDDGISSDEPPSRPAGRASGFSLIELIVTIGVIALLLAITLPALRGAREASKRTSGLASIRELARMTLMYADASGDILPFVSTPGEPDRFVTRLGPDGTPRPRESFNDPYFRANSWYYGDLLSAGGFDPLSVTTFTREEVDRYYQENHRSHVPLRAWLTHAATAAPRYWRGALATAEREDFAGQRASLVRYPSSKTLLLELGREAPDERSASIARFDGSASLHALQEFSAFSRGFGAITWQGLMTEDGLLGLDPVDPD